jgi:3-deoxy-7-phosphoheptulonate synthase
MVGSMSLAAVAAGAQGLLIEVHPRPQNALSDNDQQYPLVQFPALMERIRKTAALMETFDRRPSRAARS